MCLCGFFFAALEAVCEKDAVCELAAHAVWTDPTLSTELCFVCTSKKFKYMYSTKLHTTDLKGAILCVFHRQCICSSCELDILPVFSSSVFQENRHSCGTEKLWKALDLHYEEFVTILELTHAAMEMGERKPRIREEGKSALGESSLIPRWCRSALAVKTHLSGLGSLFSVSHLPGLSQGEQCGGRNWDRPTTKTQPDVFWSFCCLSRLPWFLGR